MVTRSKNYKEKVHNCIKPPWYFITILAVKKISLERGGGGRPLNSEKPIIHFIEKNHP